MDEEFGPSEPKIGIPEAIIVGSLIFALGWLDILPVLGVLPDLAFTQLYLHFKGLSKYFWIMLIGDACDLIPVVGPFATTIAFIIVVVLDHSPELAGVIQTAEEVTGFEEVAGLAAAAEGDFGAAGEFEGAAAARTEAGAALAEEGGSIETGVEGTSAEEESSGRPSDKARTKDVREREELERGEAGYSDEEGNGAQQGTGAETDEFATDAEASPMEKAGKEVFSPEDLEFREGRFSTGRANEEPEEASGRETEAQKNERERLLKTKELRAQFAKLRSARPKRQDESETEDQEDEELLKGV